MKLRKLKMGVCVCKENQLRTPRKAKILEKPEVSKDVRLESKF